LSWFAADIARVSTNFVERQNLTIRMHTRRFTRLTMRSQRRSRTTPHAVALHMMYYNFVGIHQTLRVTQAMAAGVSDRLWEIGDFVKLVEHAEGPAKPHGRYRKHASL
jgi:hypothetical protein